MMAAQWATVVGVDVNPAIVRLTSEAVAGAVQRPRCSRRDALAGNACTWPRRVLDMVPVADLARGARSDVWVRGGEALPYDVAEPTDREPAGRPSC